MGGVLITVLPGSLLWTSAARRRRKRRSGADSARCRDGAVGSARCRGCPRPLVLSARDRRLVIGRCVTSTRRTSALGSARPCWRRCSATGRRRRAARAASWNSFTGQFRDSCYTDIYPLYYNEGLASARCPLPAPGRVPGPDWRDDAGRGLAGALGQRPLHRGRDFYYVTVVMLAICLLVGVLATAATADREGDGVGWKAALLVRYRRPLSWPRSSTGTCSRWRSPRRPRRLGGAAAVPGRGAARPGGGDQVLPAAVLRRAAAVCLRAGKMREFFQAFGAGIVAWLVVNLPVAIPATAGWARFYAFSRDRGADWGSVWYLFEHYNVPVLGDSSQGTLNLMSSGSFAIACVAIAVLALTAPRRPRLPQLCFLLLAAFLILNKVWSPQYVVWLVPLAVLSRPRYWWWYAIWQLAEIGYFFGIWGCFVNLYQAQAGLTANWYFVLLAARLLTVGVLAGSMVARLLASRTGPCSSVRAQRRPGWWRPRRCARPSGHRLGSRQPRDP